jgi:hypothetical protein
MGGGIVKCKFVAAPERTVSIGEWSGETQTSRVGTSSLREGATGSDCFVDFFEEDFDLDDDFELDDRLAEDFL